MCECMVSDDPHGLKGGQNYIDPTSGQVLIGNVSVCSAQLLPGRHFNLKTRTGRKLKNEIKRDGRIQPQCARAK